MGGPRAGLDAVAKTKIRGCIQKFPEWVDNEIYAYMNKHSFRSNTKGYDGKTHYTDSQNSNKTATSGRELYHLQFSLQTASPETSGLTLVYDFAGNRNRSSSV
jgi:hypothetical protein